ncbi:T6SS immunity protein Tli4 family protein [Acinetobacter colistiniresistens]|uniref:T6SS immunity protein Tli4 family protein n=1 Tax=Acinetobacter colistiniresistens TaxID=280145 RepID=UPI00211BCA89|nr:T6SS immunity protein Tli4 family protein [Acinetobacter colistiniresistens]UUM26617.1 T6SS immunity protein Tli4 family protein [Acinetobacter colistiniresistens]
MKLSKSLVIGLIAICSLNACSSPNKEQPGIKEMDYNQPKTVCIGRLEVNVPKETQVTYGPLNFNGSDFEIEASVKSYQDYQKYIKDKIETLKNSPHETEGTLLKQELPGPMKAIDGSISYILVSRPTEYTKTSYEIYGYLYLGMKQLLILKSSASNEYLDRSINRMQHNLKSIKIRAPKGENQAGLCWDKIFIVDNMDENRHFNASVSFTFPSYPEVRAHVDNRGRYESDAPFIAMVKQNKAELPLEVKTLTKDTEINIAEREVNGLLGEEYSINTALRKPFQRGFEIMDWQYLGNLDDPHHPLIGFHLSSENEKDNEGYGDALVNQKAVVQLGHFILSSIRVSSNNEVNKDGEK